MMFWRKKKNIAEQEEQEKQDKVIHPAGEPEIEPPVEYDSDITEEQEESLLRETETEIIEDLDPVPVPEHTPVDDAAEVEKQREAEELTTPPEPPAEEEGKKPEEEPSGKKPEAEDGEGKKSGWLGRLTEGLSKSSAKLGQNLTDLVTKRKLDQQMLDELEDVLISSDLGPKTAAKIIGEFGQDRFGKDISDEEIKSLLAGSMAGILAPVAQPITFEKAENGPMVVLVCGVNGVGKTTTIGKIAYDLTTKQGKKVTMGAGDTFRAAAVEQLEIWAQRAQAGFVKKDLGADAAALAYEAYEQAKKDNADVLFLDTAGRLHNKANLMAELEKIIRVLKKHDENLPHAVLLVLDATTGQNAHAQVETFRDMVNVSGLVVTKLDGSAKGGVVVSLADQFGLPIHYIGVGETAEDLRPFEASDFANSLVGNV